MVALTVAIWILVVEVSIGLIAILIFLISIRNEIKQTINETHNLINTLNNKINLLSNELRNTLKNSSDITSGLKETVKKVNNTLLIINSVTPVALLFIASRSRKTKNNDFLDSFLKIGKYVVTAYQGFTMFKEYFSKGGKKNA